MPLNYSKWDALELSDDSDVEVHPNVDKRSFIRMKQRKIHQEREERKMKIESFKHEEELNQKLLKEMKDLIKEVESDGIQSMKKTASQLSATGGSVPPSENKEPTIQQMVFNLLTQILSKVEKDKPDVGDEDQACLKELNFHYTRLSEREEKRKLELIHEEAEAKKHITSEDVHDGFDVSYVDKTPSKAIDETAAPSTATKSKKTSIEVLNPNSVDSSLAAPTNAVDADSSDDEELPQLSSSAMKFAKIKASNYPASLAAIQADPSLYLDELTTDALLVEAFEAEMRGAKEHARNCVHQGLLLQYCRKLGKDGVSLFFRKVGSGEPRAMEVFITDVQTTYERIAGRCKTIKEERASDPSGGKEQIQLVATNPTTSISFEIPEGPPPEDLRLQTEDGTEAELDVEEVRGFLNDRWETFCSFPKKLQKALQTKELEKVNKVLGEMEVPEAEKVVQDLDRVGILSFSESGIIDQTGKESVKNEEDQKKEEEEGKVDEDHEAEESGKNSIEIPE
ncbi:uncharacterized protein MELLADRAFT_50897 [Melampsora larici-populina 98AG31]|uniref:Hsp90 chaperone protein kinase-targeting subunit n=1 Tax=Melampsora larici-populina (strain 98AG31 / pathotype 3-4-7) TaxID=747676 RepID=F4S9E3_MELLP|nr:uncharacterized protein MELLADRAFT_50897 [Melampsora larici-populina 98AG31]EGF98706.1 hypothetical protein MELLADRAFT_50897 [Melampsora larici-populina 98AG31]